MNSSDVIYRLGENKVEQVFTTEEVAVIRGRLLAWYIENRRKLPWRGDICENQEQRVKSSEAVTAYGILVSEFMCQQTRVATVIPYWNRWMAKFPTVRSLALATEDEVNKEWSGLGYYRRAQNLRKLAIEIVEKHGGEIPDNYDELIKLPGIGGYTAGAVLSIAFRKHLPAVDGNVIRVLSRLRKFPFVIGSTMMNKVAYEAASTLVDPTDPGTFNQSLMEYGAMVCTPTSPSCTSCVIQTTCRAYQTTKHSDGTDCADLEEDPCDVTCFPVKKQKKMVPVKWFNVYIFGDGEIHTPRILFIRRPNSGLLANQWELPNTASNEDEICCRVEREARAKSWISTHLEACNASAIGDCSVTLVGEHSSVKHVFSQEIHFYRIFSFSIKIDSAALLSGFRLVNAETQRECWVALDEADSLGLTSGCVKILKAFSKFDFRVAKRQKVV